MKEVFGPCFHMAGCVECRERYTRQVENADHWRGTAKWGSSLREEIAAKLGVAELRGDEQFEAAVRRLDELLEIEAAEMITAEKHARIAASLKKEAL